MVNDFLKEIGSRLQLSAKKAETRLQSSALKNKDVPWGLIILFAGGAYALFMLTRAVLYFFG